MTVSFNLVKHFEEPSLDETDETSTSKDSIDDETKIVSTRTGDTSTSRESAVDETKIVTFDNLPKQMKPQLLEIALKMQQRFVYQNR